MKIYKLSTSLFLGLLLWGYISVFNTYFPIMVESAKEEAAIAEELAQREADYAVEVERLAQEEHRKILRARAAEDREVYARGLYDMGFAELAEQVMASPIVP